MRILLPPKKTCRRVYKLLTLFYNKEKNNKHMVNKTPFKHALILLSNFYELPIPKFKFRRSFGHQKCIGLCYESGLIELPYPYNYSITHESQNGCHHWIGIVFHEFGHYMMWSNTEIKAMEYELKMLKRR